MNTKYKFILFSFLLIVSVYIGSAAALSGPGFCGDEGTVYPVGDISGPQGVPDCRVDLFDFALIGQYWIQCTDPLNSNCDISRSPASRDFNAKKNIYPTLVPHTNKNGVLRENYSVTDSLFPVIMWGAALPTPTVNNWQALHDANYNTIMPWILAWPENLLSYGQQYQLQVILSNKWPSNTISAISTHPNLLANSAIDEPSLSSNMDEAYNSFNTYKADVSLVAPNLSVFVSDVPFDNALDSQWWEKWNSENRISCHKSFSFSETTNSLIKTAESVSLAAQLNDFAKPLWLIVPTFETLQDSSSSQPIFYFPTPAQLRAQVYVGLVNGATGIAYYTWDNSRSRGRGQIGIAQDPLPYYGIGEISASTTQINQSRSLWEMAHQINSEIEYMIPSLLTPTVSDNDRYYQVEIEGEGVSYNPIQCLLKSHPEEGYILIVVNCDKAVFKVNFQWQDQLAVVKPLFENRDSMTLTNAGYSFEDYFEQYAVHVYSVSFIPNSGDNFVLNASFENDFDGDNKCDNWLGPYSDNTSTCLGIQDTTYKNSGDASIKLGPCSWAYIGQDCNLIPSTSYTYKAWVKTSGVTGSGVRLRYSQITPSVVSYQSSYKSGASDWSLISTSFTTLGSYATGRADICWNGITAGNAWVDDVSLVYN